MRTEFSTTSLFDAPTRLTPAGERIAAAAAQLFYEQGIRAVGVDAVAELAGTTKKTLYDCFGSKDALVAVYLVRRHRAWSAHLEDEVARHRAPRARVLAVFDAQASWAAGSSRGCAYINAWAEAGTSAPIAAVVRAEKAWMRARFDALVSDAGIRPPGRVAATLHLLYEGALVASTAGGDDRAVADARRAAAQILAAGGSGS
ncbi:TetR/AcrR family transcriptional regulator [uncultured Jatrophihabitans sp.]|uniref:TetR/AcrR family transcriptional regulator n=1 Tax=uncultured Jatrophihabitans sp. TaxID=1610747 RepID=UPI0035CBF235